MRVDLQPTPLYSQLSEPSADLQSEPSRSTDLTVEFESESTKLITINQEDCALPKIFKNSDKVNFGEELSYNYKRLIIYLGPYQLKGPFKVGTLKWYTQTGNR